MIPNLQLLMSRAELENKMAVLMGGRAAEMLVFAEVTTGAADDLDWVTTIARAMVTQYENEAERTTACSESPH